MAAERSDDAAIGFSSATAAPVTSASATGSDDSSLSSLLDRADRFRSYAVLLRLRSPWMELHQQIADHSTMTRMASEARSSGADDASAPTITAPSSSLPRHLSLSLRLCSSFHTCDYATFFALYKRICDPNDGELYDPVAMAILQQSAAPAQAHSSPAAQAVSRKAVELLGLSARSYWLIPYRCVSSMCLLLFGSRHTLPLQISALRRITAHYQPNSFLSLWHLRNLLALPSVVDAGLLCKSLCGLVVRRPDSWGALSLAEQETDAAVAAEDERAEQGGSAEWGVQIKTRAVVEADALVFKAFYSRELKRRLRRLQAQHHSCDESAVSSLDAFGLTECNGLVSAKSASQSASAAEPTDAASWEELEGDEKASSASSQQTASVSAPLWSFRPQTRYPPDCLRRWIQGV